MKKILFTLLVFLAAAIPAKAQQAQPFQGRACNQTLGIYLIFNFYEHNIVVPGQEIFGKMAGYLGDERDSRKWFFTDAKITTTHTANLEIINDYGSEDLKATLTYRSDSTYVLKQIEGSTLKIARNGKWQKLPKEMVFKLQK